MSWAEGEYRGGGGLVASFDIVLDLGDQGALLEDTVWGIINHGGA